MKKTFKTFFLSLAIGLMISCSSDTVKIGAILPETGDMSGLGVSMKSGLNLAIEELNATSDVKYELIVANAPTQREVVSAYDALRFRHGIKFFATAGSTYSMAIKPKAIQNNDLLFCVASLPDITKEGAYNVFKIGNSSIDEGEAIANYLLEGYTGDNIVLFYPNSEYGEPFLSPIKKTISSCICITYEESARDFKNIATLALSHNPSKIVAIGESPALGNLIKELRTLGFNNDIISNTMFTNSNVITAAGEAAKGVIFVDYDFDINSPSTQSRNTSIRNSYNIDFSSISFLAYSIPYFINENHSLLNGIESSVDQLDVSILQKMSDNIRQESSILVANEYPYKVYLNGDIKPSLKLKKYE